MVHLRISAFLIDYEVIIKAIQVKKACQKVEFHRKVIVHSFT